MTAKEFQAALRAARQSYPKLTREVLQQLEATYVYGAELAAAQVLKARLSGYSDLTTEAWRSIQMALDEGSYLLREKLEDQILLKAEKGVSSTSSLHEGYILDAAKMAGARSKISAVGVHNVFIGVNDQVLRSMVNRTFQDGYSFSSRIWDVGTKYQNDLKNVINAGIAQGRDIVKIAKDLQVYVRDGKIALANRFGPNLIRGTLEFMRRIGDQVDYRALRLVRSELYMALQDASKEQGHSSPGCLDLYDWVLEQGRQHWDCDCPDLAAGGPYEYDQVPEYPHPNCRCDVRPRMRPASEFMDDLKRWTRGDSVEYLDRWYVNVYSNVAA